MKTIFLVLTFLAFFSSGKAQMELSGEYKYYTANNETLPFSYRLMLNCDKTFLLEDSIFLNKDSTTTAVVKGTWIVKNNQMLVLLMDTATSTPKATGNLKKVKYIIINDQLHEEMMNERKYKRQNKKLDKQVHPCLGWEDYESFKEKQVNRYFVKINSINCM